MKKHKHLIDLLINHGVTVKVFRSGGGLRVAHIDTPKKYYGEGPDIESALKILDEDIEHGGRKYEDVYGPIHPHYWTGAYPVGKLLDSIAFKGCGLTIRAVDKEIVVEATLTKRRPVPKAISDEVIKNNKAIPFEMHNMKFLCKPYAFADNTIGTSTECLDKEINDPWTYEDHKVFKAKTIQKLLELKLTNELEHE